MDLINLDDYQVWTRHLIKYPKELALPYTALGMASEAGEAAGVVKKIIRDDNGVLNEKSRTKLIKELGDTIWYIARLSDELGVTMNEILSTNIEKLNGREIRGTINGSGDER